MLQAAYPYADLPRAVQASKVTTTCGARGAPLYIKIPGYSVPDIELYGTVLISFACWVRNANNRFTRFSYALFAPFDQVNERPVYSTWKMVVAAVDKDHPSVTKWTGGDRKVRVMALLNVIGNRDGNVRLEEATAENGYAMVGFECGYASSTCGQISRMLFTYKHLYNAQVKTVVIGQHEPTVYRDNYPYRPWTEGMYMQALVLGWSESGGDDNGLKFVDSVYYQPGLELLQRPVPEPLRCCSSEWSPYPNPSLEWLRCRYENLHAQTETCQNLLDDYCRSHMDEQRCLRRCETRNCDPLRTHWCQKVRKATAVDVVDDPALAEVCGCFLTPEIYDTFWADLMRAGLGRIGALAQYKECYFGPCARNWDTMHRFKGKTPTCQDISACFSEIKVTASGEITGPVTVHSGNKCNFSDGATDKVPAPDEAVAVEDGTADEKPPIVKQMPRLAVGVGIGVGVVVLLAIGYVLWRRLRR